jgi:CubicO group peptidase (beta-lactamase class C family)
MSDRSALTTCILLIAMVGMFSCSPQNDSTNGDKSPDTSVRIQRVEAGLVPFGEDNQPRWNERATLNDRMRHYGVPGVSIAVIEGYEIVWAEGHGTLRSGGDTQVTPLTLFHAGSTAKTVSAAATLQLVQGGRLALDEDVNDKLRSWRIPDGEFTQHEKVTLRRLLSHSGGLEDGFTNRSSSDAVPKYFTPEGVAPSVTLQQLLDAEPGIDVDGPTRVTAVPGSQYRYANADYAILELLIRDVTGKPFPAFMRETILGPLEMTSSTYEQPLPPDLRARAAIEHDHSGEAVAGDRLHIPLLAAGALWSTPSDMARFVIEMMDSYRGKSQRILSRAMASEMFSKQIEIPQNPLADAAGLGFELSGKGKDLYIVHTGATWGSTCIVWAYPETGQGAIIMTNSATGSLIRLEILLGIAREFGWPLEA